jgi:hypothetical protein
MALPDLRLRKDIWAHFPVNVDSMGRGANGSDRHCVEWHNQKVRQIAQAEGKTPDQVKKELLPRLIGSLSASRAWTVEAPEPGSKCVAVIAMRFAPANTRRANRVGNNATRRANKAKPNLEWRRSPKRASANKTNKNKPHKASNKKNNATKKAPKNLSDLTGEALGKKAMAILNKMSDATFDRLAAEFASLQPKTASDHDRLVQVLVDIAMDQQAYHPLLIRLFHVLEAKDKSLVEAVVAKIVARCMEEPLFAKMEVASENENASPNKNIEEKVLLQKRFFRATTLITGFLYRDGFLAWSEFSKVLQQFASIVFETDPAEFDYRVYDANAQALLYLLIRGGARMQAEEAAAFAQMIANVEKLSKEAKRGLIRNDALEFLDAVKNNFLIKPNMTWTIGAPTTDIKKKTPPKPKEAGLGSDIAELWRRFPLDVKQVGDHYQVRFHNKKLQERYQKDGKFKSVEDMKDALSRQILRLVDNSEHWVQGPAIPGTFLTLEPRR